MRKLFDQEFWNIEFAKYGHQSLRMLENTPGRISIDAMFQRSKDVVRVFGRTSAVWMEAAMIKLTSAKYIILAQYLDELVRARVGAAWCRKRWHHEEKTWGRTSKKASQMGKKARDAGARFIRMLLLATSPPEIQENCFTQVKEDRRRSQGTADADAITPEQFMRELDVNLTSDFNTMLTQYEALHFFLSTHLQYLQAMTFQYLQEEPADRRYLQRRYGNCLADHVEDQYEDIATASLGQMSEACHILESLNLLDANMDAALQGLMEKFTTDRNLFVRTREWLSADTAHLEAGWEGQFALVLPQTRKQRLARMKTLAKQEYFRAPVDGPVRKIVDLYHSIVERHMDIEKFHTPASRTIEALSKQISAISELRGKEKKSSGSDSEAGRGHSTDEERNGRGRVGSRGMNIFRVPDREDSPYPEPVVPSAKATGAKSRNPGLKIITNPQREWPAAFLPLPLFRQANMTFARYSLANRRYHLRLVSHHALASRLQYPSGPGRIFAVRCLSVCLP